MALCLSVPSSALSALLSSVPRADGLDYNEAYRELTHICIINPEGIKHFEKHEALAGL